MRFRATWLVAAMAMAPLPPAPAAAEAAGAVEIRYLGASGLSIRRGADRLLTAPFFSNPGRWRVAFGHVAPDETRFPDDVRELMRGAAAVLVGHAHYDHLMDLPALARLLPESAAIYGNDTVKHILAAAPDMRQRVTGLDERASDSKGPGEWIAIAGSRIRFMPLVSGHAPHIAGQRFWDGRYVEDLTRLPTRAKGWRMGQPLSFVIDFLDPERDEPRFRIYYQDAATNAPEGFPPPLDDGKDFDLAVLCVASFAQVHDHPEAILESLRPRAVLLTHWESFFRAQSKPPRPVPGTNVGRFVRRLESALPPGRPFWMPRPGETLRFDVR